MQPDADEGERKKMRNPRRMVLEEINVENRLIVLNNQKNKDEGESLSTHLHAALLALILFVVFTLRIVTLPDVVSERYDWYLSHSADYIPGIGTLFILSLLWMACVCRH